MKRRASRRLRGLSPLPPVIDEDHGDNDDEQHRTIAEMECDIPLRHNVTSVRSLFRDGSALWKSEEGDQHIVLPPPEEGQYHIYKESFPGVEDCISSAKELHHAIQYIEELVCYIDGPGEYVYLIRHKGDTVYQKISSSDYDSDEHDESFCVVDDSGSRGGSRMISPGNSSRASNDSFVPIDAASTD
jgi:hypothetical protein